MLARAVPWLARARRDGFALGAFNINTLEQAQAIVTAAELEQAPVILQVSHRALIYLGSGSNLLGLRYVAAIGHVAADSVTVPVMLHLDHGTYEEVVGAVSAGFTSVMFDGGDLPFEENLAQTQALRRLTRQMGVALEAELGETPKPGGSASEEHGCLTDPAEVPAFVAQTGIDALAIAIGSAHGGLKKDVALDLPRLAAIAAASDVPLVLHGSSGVKDADIQAGIRMGLCKINVATQLNQAFTRAVRDHLAGDPHVSDPRPYLGDARESVVAQVRERLRFIGAAGRAS